jgi:chromosome segregation ATPase
MLNRLFRNEANDRETAEELRAVLHEMQQERSRYETLLESVHASVDRLKELGEPIVKAVKDVDAVATRLGDVEERFTTIEQLSTRLLTLDERAQDLTEGQQRVQGQIVSALEDAQKIRSGFDEMSQKIDLAASLKDRLVTFLEVEKPFEQLKGSADGLRSQVENAGEHMIRLREQHDRLMDAHKLAMSKMEALDRRREELSRDMTDKERRVAGVEQAVRGMDGIQGTISDSRREMATLKATADLVSQKTAALEAQRETVDRALAQADRLEQAMRQIDAGVRQQQENEKSLGALQSQVATLRGLHEIVVERSGEITQLQRDIDERTQSVRHDLSSVTEETKKTIDRFDFERRGMETVTQRVADLRAGLSDCESRFKGVSESSRTMAELMSHTQTLATRLQALSTEAAQVEQEMAKLQAIRRDLNDTGQAAREIGTQVAKIVEARPAVEAGLRDLANLSGAHTGV